MWRKRLLAASVLSFAACRTSPITVVPVCGLTITPTFIDAGEVSLGTTVTEDLAISNGGSAPLNIQSVNIAQDGGSAFQVVGFVPISLTPGQPLLLEVTFSPEVVGPTDGTLTVVTDACEAVTPIDLTGVGVLYGVTSSPASVDFGCVLQGATGTAPALTVTNSANQGEQVTVGAFPPGSDFAVAAVSPPGVASDAGYSVWLDAGASLSISVTYLAGLDGGVGTQQASLPVSACPACAPVEIPFSATAASLSLTAAPPSGNFGIVPQGETSTLNFTVQVQDQPPSCDLVASLRGPPSMETGDDGFTTSPIGLWPASLTGAATAQLEVEYTGQAAGSTESDAVVVPFSVAGLVQPPLLIPVNAGASAGPCSNLVIDPPSINFGTVAFGAPPISQSVQITNNGPQTCDLQSIAIGTNDAFGEFSLQPGTPTTTGLGGGGAYLDLTVVFTPENNSSPLGRRGTLAITTNDPSVNPLTVPLTASVESTDSTCGGPPTVLDAGSLTALTGIFAALDYDGGGLPAVIVTSFGDVAIDVAVATDAGAYPPGFTAQYFLGTGNYPYGIVAVDLDGDHRADLVFAAESQDSVGVMLGNGDGTFRSAIYYSSGSGFPHSPAWGDFNGDGIPDIVVGNADNPSGNPGASEGTPDGGTVAVLYGADGGTGPLGTLLPPYVIPLPPVNGTTPSPYGVAVADFDNDGNVDIVSTDVQNGQLWYISGAGGAGFGAPVAFAGNPYTENAYHLAAARLRSGSPNWDLIASNADNTVGSGGHQQADVPTLDVFLGTGDAGLINGVPFQAVTAYVDDSAAGGTCLFDYGSFSASPVFNGVNDATWLSVADVNGDDVLDLVGAYRDLQTQGTDLGIWLGSASSPGSFTEAPRIPWSTTPSSYVGYSLSIASGAITDGVTALICGFDDTTCQVANLCF